MPEESSQPIEQPEGHGRDRIDFGCSDCEETVVVWSGDPYYPDYVNCPNCGALMDRE